MKLSNTIHQLIVVLTIAVLLAGCGPGKPLIVTVDFGKTPQSGGPCGGKGICSSVAPNGTSVMFALSPTEPEVLLMSFKMSELKSKQPEQEKYFTDGGTYEFDTTYNLSADQVFAPLKLPVNSRIETTTKNEVKIKNDLVVVSYHFEHDVQQ